MTWATLVLRLLSRLTGRTALARINGVVAHDLDADRQSAVRGLGSQWVRISARWWQIEPQPGWYEWAVLDEFLARAESLRVGVLMTIEGPPAWTLLDLPDWRAFCRRIADRYETRVVYGIWNEPDSAQFLVDQDAYRLIAETAASAIKGACPSARIAGPDCSQEAIRNGWLTETMATWGNYVFDIITIHAYGMQAPADVETACRALAQWKRPVWLTECGHAAPQTAYGDWRQRLYAWYLRLTLPVLDVTFWYDLWAWDGGERSGLCRPDWSPRAAYTYLAWQEGWR